MIARLRARDHASRRDDGGDRERDRRVIARVADFKSLRRGRGKMLLQITDDMPARARHRAAGIDDHLVCARAHVAIRKREHVAHVLVGEQ